MFNNMRKCITYPSILSIMLVIILSLVACSNSASETNEPNDNGEVKDTGEKTNISIYTGGSLNVQNFWEEVIPLFEAEHADIDVELVFLPSGQGGQSTMDRLLAAKKANKDSEVDIFEGGLADIVRGEEEDIFEKMDETMIPNLSQVNENNLKGTNGLAIPYRASSVVLAYNSEEVSDVPGTPEELYEWIKANPGKFSYNDPTTGGAGSSFVLTTVYNQLPDEAMDSQDESIMEEWDEGFNILKDIAPSLYKEGVYPRKNQGTLDLLMNGEVDMITAWSDMALEQKNEGLLPESIELKQIEPGFTGGPAYLMLPKNNDEKRLEAAKQLLDFVLTKEVQEIVVNKMFGYPGVEWDVLDESLQEQFESVSGDYRIFNGGALGDELNKRWQKEIAGQ